MTFDTNKIKGISIYDWMIKNGYKQGRGSSGKWRSFYSPFGSENNASFKVDVNTNKWVDYSAGVTRRQSIIDLVMKIESCTFLESCAILTNDTHVEVKVHEPKPSVSGVKIHETRNIINKELLKYITDVRKVDYDVLMKYCMESDFSFTMGKDPNAIYTGISFKNDLKGLEIRNSWQKIATSPKMFTTINGLDNTGDELILFEAFMDFMSYLTYHKILIPPKKTIVMNGTGMVNILKPFLDKKTVYSYVDSDAAADRALAELDNCNIIDCRNEFSFYSDYNEFLMDN